MKTVSSLEVAKMIEVNHGDLLRSIDKHTTLIQKALLDSKYNTKTVESNFAFNENNTEIVEGQSIINEYWTVSSYQDSIGRKLRSFEISKKGCEYISSKLTSTKGALFSIRYIEKFNQMEKTIQQQQPQLPKSFLEALKALVVSEEEKVLLQQQNSLLLPKAEYTDKVLKRLDLITTKIVAKRLGFKSAQALNQYLNTLGIIYKQGGTWMPYANYDYLIKDGYAGYHTYDTEKSNSSLKWTEKGIKWINDKLQQHQMIPHNCPMMASINPYEEYGATEW